MNIQGLHGEPRETRGTTIGNTGNYENKGQYRVPRRTRGSDYTTLTLDFMNKNGLRPCFKAWTTNGNVVRKNPKGELAALRLEFYCTATSVVDLEYWNRQVRQFKNGKTTGVWRKGDLQLDFRKGIMNLVDLQGRVWTANEWELLRNGVEAKASTVEEQTKPDEDMPKRVEVPCASGSAIAGSAFECGIEDSQGPGRAWEATKSYALSLSEHRKDMLRVILNDEAIDREWKDKMVSDLLTNWFNEDAQGRAILESAEEQPDRVNLSVGEVVSSGVDIDNGKQDMGVLAPLGEQQGQEFAEDRDQGLSETEVASDSDVGSTREELWPPGEVTSEGDEQPGMPEEIHTGVGPLEVMGARGLPTVEDSNGVSVRAGLSISEEGTPDGEVRRVTGIEKQDFTGIGDDYMGDDLLKEIAEECEKRQSCAGENHDQLLPEVMAVSSGSNTRGVDDVWGGYTDNCYRVFEEKIGDFGAIDTQNITKGDLVEHSGQRLGDLIDFGGLKEASVSHGTVDVLGDEAGVSVFLDEQPVAMDKVESEEMFYLGKIEIGVCAGEPYIAKEREVSVITSMEIIAGDDVKEKDIGKSGDFQVGGAIRDDSIVSIMSMDYEGCCFQEESMETQRQERDVVDYNSDDGDTTSAKFKYGRPAFAPGGIGMFVVTGRPPGRLIGG